jgi:CheY-like chemotaxis protein
MLLPSISREDNVPANRSDLRIVIVDDNPDATYALAMLLERAGFTVIAQIYDPEQAVDCILSHQPHVAILDIAMPTIDGYEIAQQLREQLNLPLKLIAISGLGQPSDKTDALAAGFDAHFTKPANWPKLEALLLSFLEESAPAKI